MGPPSTPIPPAAPKLPANHSVTEVDEFLRKHEDFSASYKTILRPVVSKYVATKHPHFWKWLDESYANNTLKPPMVAEALLQSPFPLDKIESSFSPYLLLNITSQPAHCKCAATILLQLGLRGASLDLSCLTQDFWTAMSFTRFLPNAVLGSILVDSSNTELPIETLLKSHKRLASQASPAELKKVLKCYAITGTTNSKVVELGRKMEHYVDKADDLWCLSRVYPQDPGSGTFAASLAFDKARCSESR